MNPYIIAVIFQEGGKFISELIRSRPKDKTATVEFRPDTIAPETGETTTEEEREKVETGCVPCSIGHLGTCVGVINEAMRFAKKDGLESKEVIDRTNMCLDELNALERVDLRPEMIAGLPTWEKDLANQALSVSRETRHSLESLSNVSELETAAAKLQHARQGIGRAWFKERLAKMPKEEKAKLAEKAIEKLEEE